MTDEPVLRQITHETVLHEVSLENISPYRLSMWDRLGGFEKLPESKQDEGGYHLDTSIAAMDKGDTFIVRFRVRVPADDVVIVTDNGAIYSKPADAELDDLAQQVLVKEAVLSIYPYVREQVAALAGRAGHEVNLAILRAEQLDIGPPEEAVYEPEDSQQGD